MATTSWPLEDGGASYGAMNGALVACVDIPNAFCRADTPYAEPACGYTGILQRMIDGF